MAVTAVTGLRRLRSASFTLIVMTPFDAAVGRALMPTGVLRAAINLGNPVLAQGTAERPRGVTVDIARELASRLGAPIELRCFDAARKSFEAITTGEADIAFLAIEPAREHEVAFTAPYVVIEGVFVVSIESSITTPAEADREDVRIGVKTGSAYDLFLTRTLQHAQLVRGDEGVDLFFELGLEVAAGIRQPLAKLVEGQAGIRLIDERFMEIRQAVATARDRGAETVHSLRGFVEELKTEGFVAAALERSKQQDLAVAPPD